MAPKKGRGHLCWWPLIFRFAHPPADQNGMIPSLQRRIFDIPCGLQKKWPQKAL
jgi:hypothetical protein